MRGIIYGFLVVTSLGAAYRMGMSSHGAAGNSLVLVVVVLGAFFLLTRRLCLVLGSAGLAIGVLGPAMVWTYGSLFIQGDPSGYGMLGTLLAFCFLPAGAGLVLAGLLKAS